jgi:hypothetical protein
LEEFPFLSRVMIMGMMPLPTTEKDLLCLEELSRRNSIIMYRPCR